MKKIVAKEFDQEVLTAGGPVLVDFAASWCVPCRMLRPMLEAMEKDYPGVKFVQVDIDEAKELVEKYTIMSVPTVKLFVGGEVKETLVGPKKDGLAEMLGKAESAG